MSTMTCAKRSRIALDEDMVDEDSDEVVDVVLLWFRDDDGDLVDALVDAIAPLADNGVIWLLTPKRGRAGYVEPSDISEAAPTAGLSQTSLLPLAADWTGGPAGKPAGQGRRRARQGGPSMSEIPGLSPLPVGTRGAGLRAA